ncbi:MAG: DNA replication/repair protein RecF [Clostridia bacterium]|nr:DNA replication/repair protein RecF [Clostridia bacterium]
MNVRKHIIKDYRNINELELEPVDGVNVIFGDNGQGKTNIIESIWLFTGCNSFRTRKNIELIKNGCENAELSMDFYAGGREQNARLVINTVKETFINDIRQVSARSLLGRFQAIVFSPAFLSVIKDGPSERRRFIDTAISLIKPNYAALLLKYNKTLFQRNSLLRQISVNKTGDELLYAFDEELAKYGGRIIDYRVKYIDDLKNYVPDIYSGISKGREKIKIKYTGSLKEKCADSAEYSRLLYDETVRNHERDIFRQTTNFGPHKDDLDIFLDDLNVRIYGSQGQQRSGALALKLSEAEIIKEISGEKPVALLDDVMSELDDKRQKYLIKYFDGWQVFVTCCDRAHLKKIRYDKSFRITDGRLWE